VRREQRKKNEVGFSLLISLAVAAPLESSTACAKTAHVRKRVKL